MRLDNNIDSCGYCRTCYNKVLEETRKIDDKDFKKMLLKLWKLLYINGCTDFDIIRESFKVTK